MKQIVFIAISFVFLIENSIQIGPSLKSGCVKNYNATTNQLKQIILGRCYYFLNIAQINNCFINVSKYDCNLIWNEFENVVVGKDPCSLRMNDFDRLIEMTDHVIGENTTLFWSGTYLKYNKNIVTLSRKNHYLIKVRILRLMI